MMETAPTKADQILQALRAAGRGIRRGVVAATAAVALVVIYGVSAIGTHLVTAVGVTGLTVAATTTTATPAQARRRGGRRGGRRRRQGRRRARRRRGNNWEWYWAPYWYWW